MSLLSQRYLTFYIQSLMQKFALQFQPMLQKLQMEVSALIGLVDSPVGNYLPVQQPGSSKRPEPTPKILTINREWVSFLKQNSLL